MYAESKQYLINKLREAGLKSKPYTTEKALKKSMESHLGAVLFDSETFSRNGSKKHYKDQEGARKKRRKVFDRTTAFTVILGDYNDESVEIMLENFLASLDTGIYVKENFVPIEVESADWVDEDDSILKAKVAVQVKINFLGGIYKDTGFARVKELEVESVERKEPTDGN